jgi:hypothetical protein
MKITKRTQCLISGVFYTVPFGSTMEPQMAQITQMRKLPNEPNREDKDEQDAQDAGREITKRSHGTE